jgi:thioredoxin-like negative regulator of GroEL
MPGRPQPPNPTAAAQAALAQALALHQRGQLVAAERIYQDILRQQPNHFDALHLLGLISAQTGRTERGVDLIRRGDPAQRRRRRRTQQSRQRTARTAPVRRSAGEFRQGDRAEARRCRRAQ